MQPLEIKEYRAGILHYDYDKVLSILNDNEELNKAWCANCGIADDDGRRVYGWVAMFEKFYAGFCAAKTVLKIGTSLYVVVAHEQWADNEHSENKAVFMQYRNAIAYVNSLPENYKVSYDIEEIICGDE